MKKFLAAFILLVFLGFTGCGVKQTETTPQEQTKVVRSAEFKLSEALLNAPSKFVLASNGVIYESDENGKNIEKVAVVSNNYQVRIYGTSPSLKWVILDLDPNGYTEQFLYALNIETLELIKVSECDWEGGFITSFRLGDDKLLYGFQGVNAPICSLACFDLNSKNVTYLLDCSKNKEEKAYEYDISPDGKYIAYAGGNVEVFPDNRTALYLKNLETGEVKILVKPSNLNQNLGTDYISDVEFVNGGKEILYSRVIWMQDRTTKYFILGFDGHSKEISTEEASKFIMQDSQILEAKLKVFLNKNLHIYAILDKCNKIVFTVFNDDDTEELYLCNEDFSNVVDTGISKPNFMNFSNNCKFTCQILPASQTFGSLNSTWYLIDAENATKINLNELLKMTVDDIIYIGK